MDLFEKKDLMPMLIGMEQPAFCDPDYIFELKMDGERCLAYLDHQGTDLRNKRNLKLIRKFPELKEIHKQVKTPCILDGELYIYKNGKTDFFEVQSRTLSSNSFKIQLASRKYPATFTAFDVLYAKGREWMHTPLMERKKCLQSLIKETARINISRYIEEDGISLFEQTSALGLEGIVAKKKDSLYHLNKRTKDWIKCKNLLDDDFVIAGYVIKEKGVISLILGQYDQAHQLVYKGHVTMGVHKGYIDTHCEKAAFGPFSSDYPSNQDAVWITPMLVGTVKFMEYNSHGGLRQPVFKGFREDKTIEECTLKP